MSSGNSAECLQFCIRDDDTSFFTSPEELERAYGDVTLRGPVSLAVVPFCRAGTSKGVPEAFRGRWTVHPLHENAALVDYLRERVRAGRFEIMLHGHSHDEPHGRPEFERGADLGQRVAAGRAYLEDLLRTSIRMFVPPHNTIGAEGLDAIARAGLHLGGTAGVRAGWPRLSPRTWRLWLALRRRRQSGEPGIPWVLDLGDHREIPGTPITPRSTVGETSAIFESAAKAGGVFCAATHYWEFDVKSTRAGEPSVGDQLNGLVRLATSTPNVMWRSVGDIVSEADASLLR